MSPAVTKRFVFVKTLLRCVLWCLFLLGASANAQSSDTTLRLVFAGDLMGHVPLHTAAQQGKNSYDYAPCFQYVKDYIQSADMLIVGGTSLVVYPAAGLVNYYRGNKLVLINKSTTPFDEEADLVLHMGLGEVFGQLSL